MILNTFALVSLFIGALSLFLIGAALFLALRSHHQIGRCENADDRFRAQDRLHLSFLLLSTAFILRLTTWPLFYFLLHSFIPLVPGAMCTFGVTRVMPAFVTVLQILKPLAFFLIGGWLILYRLDLSHKTRTLIKQSVRFLFAVSAVAIIDAMLEILFVFVFSPPGVAVSCCTAVTDIVAPSAALRPVAFFNVEHRHILLALYHGFSLGLLVLIGFMLRQCQ
jgi:hypothetical protein